LAKPTSRFVCQSCGAVSPKWAGRCEACEEWNSIVEEAITPRPGPAAKGGAGRRLAFVDLAGSAEPPPRRPTGIAELDRVLGGGLVPASAVLVGGDPGIGKSTLLLQAAAGLARAGRRVCYISGEESIEQTRLRARRLGVQDAPLELAAAINLRDIAASLASAGDAALVVIDSIQTMWLVRSRSAPGTVARVGHPASTDPACEGGGRCLGAGQARHEGWRHRRAARAGAHGRCGAVFRRRPRPPVPHPARGEEPLPVPDGSAWFEMTDPGAGPGRQSSALFRRAAGNVAGSSVFAGRRGPPVLVECRRCCRPTPRHRVARCRLGRRALRCCSPCWSARRAAAERHRRLPVTSPAAYGSASLPPTSLMAAALVSAATDTPTDAGMVYFGEIGLSGEVRQVAQADARLKEAAKLGFGQATLPRRVARGNRQPAAPAGLELAEIGHISDLIARFAKDLPHSA
jgi:DNA repair protein RadA/Sms